MTLQRMDNVGIIVDDLQAAIAFFVELGMELENEMTEPVPATDRFTSTQFVVGQRFESPMSTSGRP